MISVLVPTLTMEENHLRGVKRNVNIVRLRFLGLFFDMLHSKRAH